MGFRRCTIYDPVGGGGMALCQKEALPDREVCQRHQLMATGRASVQEAVLSMSNDKSRNGSLVHSATSQGRTVEVVAYLEGGTHPIKSSIICRTSEQAAEVARVLTETPCRCEHVEALGHKVGCQRRGD